MAIGLSKLFNVNLPVNFHSPYRSLSIIELWHRWHITLSRFLKEYVYISLGNNRTGSTRRYVNILVTMFIGGLWHGAGWTLAVWGLVHGSLLCINHLWRKLASNFTLPEPPAWSLTFTSVVFCWVFFRAQSLA